MKTLPKAILAVPLTRLAAGSMIDLGGFNLNQ
jgi:hypothetical protein